MTREQIHAKIAEQYALSPEDAVAMVTAPETVLPKLAANMHMQVMTEVIGFVQHALKSIPEMLNTHVEGQRQEQEAENMAFAAWPGLRAHKDVFISNIVAARKAQGASATPDAVLQAAGMMTAYALGLDPAQVRSATVAAPVAPPVGTQIPPKPPGAGTAGGAPTPAPSLWETLANYEIE